MYPGSARAPSRACGSDRALAIANFAESQIDCFRLHGSWMLILDVEGISARAPKHARDGACAPRNMRARRPQNDGYS